MHLTATADWERTPTVYGLPRPASSLRSSKLRQRSSQRRGRNRNRGGTPLLLSGLQVVFLAEFVQEFELGFQPVDVFFFGF